MKPKITKQNLFENKTTQSILNLLLEYEKEGLRPIEIQYILENENGELHKKEKEMIKKSFKERDGEFESNISKIKERILEDKLYSLGEANRIIRGCISDRTQLNYHLKKLGENEGIGVIRKDGNNKKTRYFIKKNAYNEGIRIQNKESLDIFPLDKIIDFNIMYKNIYNKEFIHKKIILYGLSKKLFKNMSEEKRCFDDLLNEIYQVFKKFENKYNELRKIENKKREKLFFKKTKSNRIKKILEDQHIDILGNFSFFVWVSKYDKNMVDLTKSKEHFILQFKYATGSKRKNISDLEDDCTLVKFNRFVDSLSDKKYSVLWGKVFVHKNYYLTRKDIDEIVEWAWDNRDIFDMFFPGDFALSVYGSRKPNLLINVDGTKKLPMLKLH